ncbi:hypothetical protein ACTA71_001811 [Dictyostelium dimigraforme]
MISSLNSINTLFINKGNISPKYLPIKENSKYEDIKTNIINIISKELENDACSLILDYTLDNYKISDESALKIKEYFSPYFNNFSTTQVKNLKIIDIIDKTIFQLHKNNCIKFSKL